MHKIKKYITVYKKWMCKNYGNVLHMIFLYQYFKFRIVAWSLMVAAMCFVKYTSHAR